MPPRNHTWQNDWRVYIRYLLPSMLSMLAVSCYSFVDTFVVGKAIGSLAVGAMGLATPALSFLFALGFLFGTGGGIRYAVHLSQGQKKEASGVFTIAVWSAVVVGLLITAGGLFFIRDIARFLGATSANMTLSVSYLRWILALAPVLILDIIFNSFMRNDGHPAVSMTATLTGTGLNIVLDFWFVLGLRWGMDGAAAATCLGSVVSVGINAVYAFTHPSSLRFTSTNLSPRTLFTVTKLGTCSFFLESAVAVITVIFVNAAGQRFGDDGIAAFSAILTFNLVVYSLLNGVAQSMQPLVSAAHGRGDTGTMTRFLHFSLVPSIGIGLIATGLALWLSRPLAALFLSDKATALALASFGLKCFSVTFLFMAVSVLYGIYYQAKEAIIPSLLILLGRSLILPVAALLVLSPLIGNDDVWIAIPAGEGMTFLLSLAFRWHETRQKRTTGLHFKKKCGILNSDQTH